MDLSIKTVAILTAAFAAGMATSYAGIRLVRYIRATAPITPVTKTA